MGLRIGIERLFIANRIRSLADIVREILYNFKTRVLNDGGEVNSYTDLSSYITMAKANGIYDSIKFGMLGAYNIRTSGDTKYVTKGYDITPDEKLGDELVTNGGFDTDSDWGKGANITIEEGKVVFNLPDTKFSSIYQPLSLIAGKRYRFTIQSSNYISGSAILFINDSVPSTIKSFASITGNGDYEYEYTAIGTEASLNLGRTSGTILKCSFDNISVKEVLNMDYTATQTTEASQPFLSGFIAPNEKWGLKNPNGGSRYMTHPTISFAANEAWSVSINVNNFSYDADRNYFILNNVSNVNFRVGFRFSSSNRLLFIYIGVGEFIYFQNIEAYIGKNIVITFVYDGISSVTSYINGANPTTSSPVSPPSVDLFSIGYFSVNSAFCINSYIIRNQALTPTQVAAEATKLRQIFPEIPSVTIGSQTWATSNCEMVSTPMENAIANVTSNATWATSQTLYDNAYAATVGTNEEKTYAAVKAAAMWCYYNNDASIGAIYGKLYNWFAVKLLQMDIDYYNAANPTTPWGYHVPSSTEFNTLTTALGGASVAGGKMKAIGIDYWSSPNTGADNSSGFSAIGGGFRVEDGTFTSNALVHRSHGINADLSLQYSNSILNLFGTYKIRGYSLRLIKD